MEFNNIVELFSGISFFLFGMLLMGDGLKKLAGNKMEMILYKLTESPLKGIIFGTAITTVIQSSSATSVMLVGFVNSGLMKLSQAIPVVLGAILGTSITGWVICLSALDGASGIMALFSTSTLTGICAVIGIYLRMFSKNKEASKLGDILLGFAVLMFGMSVMSGAVSPLKDSAVFRNILTSFSNPIIGILAGAAFTCIIQSASAAVGIVQALTVTGSITFDIALPLIMGIAIGAALPVLLSSIGATPDGKRTSLAYLISNVLGVIFVAPIFYILNYFIKFSITSLVLDTVGVALLNTVYRFIVVSCLLPFYKRIEHLTTLIIKSKGSDSLKVDDLVMLEERFLNHPALALEQCKKAMNDMAKRTIQNITESINLNYKYSKEEYELIFKQEEYIDKYEDMIDTYLMKLTLKELNEKQNETLSLYLHTVSDFERLSDYATNIADSAKELNEKKVHFSADAAKEIAVMESAVSEILNLAVNAFRENDLKLAEKVEPLEQVIDYLCDKMKMNHVLRLKNGVCSINVGFAFNDLLTGYERIADHCSNLAVALISTDSNSFETHAYLHDLKKEKPDFFIKYEEEYLEKYAI